MTKPPVLAHFCWKGTICPPLILVYNACKLQHWQIRCKEKNRSIFCLILVLKQPHDWWLSVYASYQDPRLLLNKINRQFPTHQSAASVKLLYFTVNAHAIIPRFPQNYFFNKILLEELMCVWGGGDVGFDGCYLSMSVCECVCVCVWGAGELRLCVSVWWERGCSFLAYYTDLR